MNKMKLISKLIKSLSFTFRLNKSWAYLSKGDVCRSELEIDELFLIYRNPFPEHHIMRGYIKYKAKKYSEAIQEFEISLEKLEQVEKFNQDTKNYLKVFLRGPMAFSIAMAHEKSRQFEILSEEELQIDLSNVPSRIREHYRTKDLETAKKVTLIG
ncbi:hypothetical protein [Thalassospira sp. UBA4513]|uniref:hypothetical protein n=1 Tax=Thalassospira sp. UBA4513 TaxID=1947675 RepID=UPI00257D42E3|nr:hypothetical protein [Thalassospira sp. UBA4513]|tara:strand:- start:241 stop:708 length:468 start_codon:yes stop_codon:yes gene_type:complete